MRRGVPVWMLCFLFVPTAYSCGNITHEIGQIQGEHKSSDGGDSTVPKNTNDGGQDGTSDRGKETTTPLDATDGPGSESGPYHNDGGIVGDDGEVLEASLLGCFQESVEFAPAGLDIYIMMDALLFSAFTLSTTSPQSLWTNLWTQVGEQIATFVDDADSADIGVGIKYYGDSNLFNLSTLCLASTYATPAVSIDLLPLNADKIKNSFPQTPFILSPAVPALEGAIDYTRSRAPNNPDRKQVVFLIAGSSLLVPICNSTIDDLINVAREGFSGVPSITTYMIGIYAYNVDDLYTTFTNPQLLANYIQNIALRGGTLQPYIASFNQGLPDLVQKLRDARDSAKDLAKRTVCALNLTRRDLVPTGSDSVSLIYTPAGDTPIVIQRVADKASCSSDTEGWYFDDPVKPTRLLACERTCETLNSVSQPQLQLRVNCD